MLINGKAFDGLTRHFNTHRMLQWIAGGAYWFPEFKPERSDSVRIVFDILVRLFQSGLCCNLNGSFPTFVAGLQKSFRLLVLNVAIEDIQIIRFLLQREEDTIVHFNYRPFEFHFQHAPRDDICRYKVIDGDNSFRLLVLGIDTPNSCCTLANVDFVHFLSSIISDFDGTR
jgi:hypothetical protein